MDRYTKFDKTSMGDFKMCLKQTIYSHKIKGVVLSVFASIAILGCGGGGSSSVASLTSNQISNEVSAKYPTSTQNVAVQIGFSPVVDRTCDFYFTNSIDTRICLNINKNTPFAQNPKISLGANRVDYFVDLTETTESTLGLELSNLDSIVKKPLFISDFPVNFGVHDDYSSYTPIGKICTENGVISMVAYIEETNTSIDMVPDENDCYTISEDGVSSNGFGTFNIRDLIITDSSGDETHLEGDLGHFTYNEYSNVPPESNIVVLNNNNYLTISNFIRDINGNISFTCSGSDIEDGNGVVLSAKYKTDSDLDYISVALDENNSFSIDISNMGSKTLKVVCLVKDSYGISTDSNLSLYINKNTAPIYQSGLSDRFCTQGTSISIGTPIFTDEQNDTVTTLLSVPALYNCSSTGVFVYKATGSDGYLSSESPEYMITVIPSNTNNNSDGSEDYDDGSGI